MLPTFRGVPRSPPASDRPSLSPLVGEGLPRDVSCSSSLRREPRASHWGRATPRLGRSRLRCDFAGSVPCRPSPPPTPSSKSTLSVLLSEFGPSPHRGQPSNAPTTFSEVTPPPAIRACEQEAHAGQGCPRPSSLALLLAPRGTRALPTPHWRGPQMSAALLDLVLCHCLLCGMPTLWSILRTLGLGSGRNPCVESWARG